MDDATAEARLGVPIRLLDAIQWAVEESIERNPTAWPKLIAPYRCAMSKDKVRGLDGRLVFWYTFDASYIHFWYVELLKDANV